MRIKYKILDLEIKINNKIIVKVMRTNKIIKINNKILKIKNLIHHINNNNIKNIRCLNNVNNKNKQSQFNYKILMQ